MEFLLRIPVFVLSSCSKYRELPVPHREVLMQEIQVSTSLFHAPIPRGLESYDSGEEFSLQHWMDVCLLVDQADMQAGGIGEGLPAELERAMEETLLEVESAAAN